ncbi:neuromedin-B receptor-like isoform X1 [Hydractinia symbiolongicarpus]|uniref:neuromedin-B receptor-like isoform X1 n=2 Tax=Hydractinia symbiolongicarpus TaxID=13093 RepID=UPI00254E786D|nr:neuromedin-B receptor-like isoform X1 [Hydractinia symbiolongicarpus]XP_057290024.1 neuromedin-B receptor-like isoform X1 [Hydractinia symbiolongicarpus]
MALHSQHSSLGVHQFTIINMTGSDGNYTGIPMEILFSPVDVVTMIILTGIFSIGLLGNLLVVYIFGVRSRNNVKRFERFLLMLGFIDLASSVIIPLSFMYLTATKFQQWHFGEIGCKLIPSLLQISITLSQGVLILISYERYHTLVKPFNDPLSRGKIGLWILIVVALSIFFVLPYMSTFSVHENQQYNTKTCAPDSDKTGMSLGSALLQVTRDIIALGVMGFLGFRMNRTLVKQHDNLTWRREKMSRKGRRLLKLVIIIFSILTLPLDIYQVIFYAVVHSNVHISKKGYEIIVMVNTFLNLVQTSNSVVNVFIYSRMHSMFTVQCCIQQRERHSRRRHSSRWGESFCTETEVLNGETKRMSKMHKV